jgi:hypothetical protein
MVWPGQTISTTRAIATEFVFGASDSRRRSTVQYYEDVSYGQLTWTGDVTPTLSIADPLGCSNRTDLYEIAHLADNAAVAAGYNLSDYDNRMYNFPSNYCGQAAWGEISGARSWISNELWNIADGFARMQPDHELGHMTHQNRAPSNPVRLTKAVQELLSQCARQCGRPRVSQ